MAKSRKTSSARAASRATAETTAVQSGTDDPDDLSPTPADPVTGDDAEDTAADAAETGTGATATSGSATKDSTRASGKDPVAAKKGSGSGQGADTGKGSKTSTPGTGSAGTPGSEVTEKAKDATRAGSPKKAAAAESARTSGRRVAAEAPNPSWLAPTAVVLLIVGLAYLVAFYLSAGALPLPIGDWNLAAGFGVMLVGGGMLMFWK